MCPPFVRRDLPEKAHPVARDNAIQLGDRWLQTELTDWRRTLAGCRVMAHEHLDGTLTIRFGPHVVGRYNAQGWPLLEGQNPRGRKVVEKLLRGKPKPGFPFRLEIPQRRRDSHSYDGGG
jgi:hypothetical protein